MKTQQLIKCGLLALAVIALIYLVSNYGKMTGRESFYVETEETKKTKEDKKEVDETEEYEDYKSVEAGEPLGDNETYYRLHSSQDNGEFGLAGNQYPSDCFPKDQLSPGELLPGDANSKWSQSVPAGQGELGDQNFLTAGYHVGVNTVGQTLRNSNQQIRSEPPNPQVKVSPWLQTTIEPDTNRRPMEIGGCE